MQFRILGPVEIQDERTGLRILPAGTKQRALLGALVARSGHVVPVRQLIDELWGHRPPANAANALQAHVARLRRLVPEPGPGPWPEPGPWPGPGPGPGAGAVGRHREWLVTRPPGYLLRPGPGASDAQRFRELAARGRAAAATDPRHAAELLRAALALWRGPALEGSARGGICAAEAARLEEQRLTVLETLYDACLRAARHDEIIGELEELTADHPMRERFHDLLMVALYRCGRQAEALGVYDRARRRLVRELGVEPGAALRGRLDAILRHDPDLAPPRPPAGHGPLASVHPMPLPALPPLPAGTAGPDATVLSLSGELARLQHRIESLSAEQHALMRRFDQLVAQRAAGQ
ncbi:BTAD domain-containing putative transcriptional regulator [Streptomyces sp. NPDC060027]|uniref:AfsR/SARP family transcriptional regulator n=1 Tax=Streptomyces sp. NPDC060027 TaxID=3347040 RepID=UPI0036A115F0